MFPRAALLTVLFTANASLFALPCEEELAGPSLARFIPDVKSLKQRLSAGPLDLNPNYYHQRRGSYVIAEQARAVIEDTLRPYFDPIDEELAPAAALLLLRTNHLVARITLANQKLRITRLWLNYRDWREVEKELLAEDRSGGATAVMRRLHEITLDKSRIAAADLNPGLKELHAAASEGRYVDLFRSNDRHHAALAARARTRVLDKLQEFMDFRTANGTVQGLIGKGAILSLLRVDQRDQNLQIQQIEIIDQYGMRSPLLDVADDLRRWYQRLNAERLRQARAGEAVDPDPAAKLVSRIYERPDAQPLMPDYWRRFRSDSDD